MPVLLYPSAWVQFQALGSDPSLLSMQYPERKQMLAEVVGSLKPIWETKMEFLASG